MEPGLASARYLSLTTQRRDGRSVATPVWFVVDDDRLLVWTDADSGKVKRIRVNPRVQVAACDVRGGIRGRSVPGAARVLDDEAERYVHQLLRKKHKVLKPALDIWHTFTRAVLRRPAPASAYLEIRLDTPD